MLFDCYYYRRTAIKQSWERDRAQIGSQWAWLCHQITTLNQKLYQLDSLLHSKDPKEMVQLAPHAVSNIPPNIPCVCDHKKGTNGSNTILPTSVTNNNNKQQQQGQNTIKPLVNGVQCTCQVRQMLLSNPSLVSHPVQVGDLMGYSFPVLLMDDTIRNGVSARTKGTACAPKRKLVRMKRRRRQEDVIKKREERVLGDSYHPHLSQPQGNYIEFNMCI